MITFADRSYRVWSRDPLGGEWEAVGEPIGGLRVTLRETRALQRVRPHRVYLVWPRDLDPNGGDRV